jgi:hypothetical protein
MLRRPEDEKDERSERDTSHGDKSKACARAMAGSKWALRMLRSSFQATAGLTLHCSRMKVDSVSRSGISDQNQQALKFVVVEPREDPPTH